MWQDQSSGPTLDDERDHRDFKEWLRRNPKYIAIIGVVYVVSCVVMILVSPSDKRPASPLAIAVIGALIGAIGLVLVWTKRQWRRHI